MYTATKWDTVEDKEKFEKHFKRFVMSGFKRTLFYKWFYTRLSSTFGHIAHYNKSGFYDYFFTSAAGRKDFINDCMRYPCYGDPVCTYSDVEKELQGWLKENQKEIIEKF